MAKYLIQANYIGEGIKGLLKEGGSSRRKVVDELLASVGGKVESFYYAFGDIDAFVIVDVPDNVTAAAVALTVGASGAVTLKTTVLMTPEEVDQATKKSPAYRAPGA
ncbi:MAG TPA: GYD domain-containing protein [Dehalococcoidia bacterium]|nr:GYD domain-containing protein [Dehalococcoidia bacterium]